MKKKILAVVAAALGVMSFAMAEPTFAAGGSCPAGSLRESYNSSIAECNMDEEQADETTLMKTVQTIINVILGILGIVTVAVIIIGGFQYVTSTGDASKATKARNTILYGVIGLIIALLAFAIVNFVLGSVFGEGGSGGGSGSADSSETTTDGSGSDSDTDTGTSTSGTKQNATVTSGSSSKDTGTGTGTGTGTSTGTGTGTGAD